MEVFDDLKKVVIKELKKLIEKGDLSPSELETAKCAAGLVMMLGGDSSEMTDYEGDYSNASMHGDTPYRRYNITAYGNRAMPYGSYHDERNTMEDDWYSMAQRRGADGRFMSGRPYYEQGGFSRHSFTDRLVATLEREYASAENEHEQRQLSDLIRYVRMSE